MTQVLDKETLRKDLLALRAEGIASLAVVLMHSYIYPNHEKEVGLVAMEMGFKHVSLSSDVMPMVRIVPRGFTGERYWFVLSRTVEPLYKGHSEYGPPL